MKYTILIKLEDSLQIEAPTEREAVAKFEAMDAATILAQINSGIEIEAVWSESDGIDLDA
jgi:hypothetical protein